MSCVPAVSSCSSGRCSRSANASTRGAVPQQMQQAAQPQVGKPIVGSPPPDTGASPDRQNSDTESDKPAIQLTLCHLACAASSGRLTT
jgi:hypothetical protein